MPFEIYSDKISGKRERTENDDCKEQCRIGKHKALIDSLIVNEVIAGQLSHADCRTPSLGTDHASDPSQDPSLVDSVSMHMTTADAAAGGFELRF